MAMWHMPSDKHERQAPQPVVDLSASNSSGESVAIAPREDGQLHIPELIMKVLPDAKFDMPTTVLVGSQGSGKTFLLHRIIHYFLSTNSAFTSEMCNVLCELLPTGRNSKWPTKVRFVHQHSSSESCRGSMCEMRLSYSTQHNALIGSSEFEAIRSLLLNLGVGDDVYGGTLEITFTTDSVPNMSFLDTPGLTSREFSSSNKRFLLDGSSDATYLRALQHLLMDPRTSVVAVEAATVILTGMEKSHTLSLLKSMEVMRPNICEHTVMVWTKCDMINTSTMLAFILPTLQASATIRKMAAAGHSPVTTSSTTSNMSPMMTSSVTSADQLVLEMKLPHVIAMSNRTRSSSNATANQSLEMQDVTNRNGYKYLHERSNGKEKNFFSTIVELPTGPCWGMDALFEHLDHTFLAAIPAMWSKAYSDFKVRVNRYEKDLRMKLAPSPGLYWESYKRSPSISQQTTMNSVHTKNDEDYDSDEEQPALQPVCDPFHPSMIFEEFYVHLRLFLTKLLETSYLMSSVSLEFDLDSWPDFQMGHMESYVHRIRLFDRFRDLMDTQLNANLEYLQHKLMQRENASGFMAFNSFTPFHCLDRFPHMCEWLQGNLLDVVLVYVKDQVHKKIQHFLTVQWETYESVGELTKARMAGLFAAVDHLYSTLTFHFFMAKVVELGYPWQLNNNLEMWLVEDRATMELRRFMHTKYRIMLFETNTLLLSVSPSRCRQLLVRSLPIVRKLQTERFHANEVEDWEPSLWHHAFELHQEAAKQGQLQSHFDFSYEDVLDMDEADCITPKTGTTYESHGMMEEDEDCGTDCKRRKECY